MCKVDFFKIIEVLIGAKLLAVFGTVSKSMLLGEPDRQIGAASALPHKYVWECSYEID
jgi:hypothetical protein